MSLFSTIQIDMKSGFISKNMLIVQTLSWNWFKWRYIEHCSREMNFSLNVNDNNVFLVSVSSKNDVMRQLFVAIVAQLCGYWLFMLFLRVGTTKSIQISCTYDMHGVWPWKYHSNLNNTFNELRTIYGFKIDIHLYFSLFHSFFVYSNQNMLEMLTNHIEERDFDHNSLEEMIVYRVIDSYSVFFRQPKICERD